MLCDNEVNRALSVSVFVQMCLECLALSAWKGNVCCAWLTKSKAPTAASCLWTKVHFTTPGQMTINIYLQSLFYPSPKTTGQHLLFSPQSVCLFLTTVCQSIHHPLYLPPHSLSLPSAQTYHTGSLFLANLSLIHYWDLFFFRESQNEEKGTDLLNI